jgi:hypothetical protein
MRLAGKWYNQLGSEMELNVQGGQITGTYKTKVGSAKGIYQLVGRTDTDDDNVRNVGFVVSWENENGSSDSVTSWSGELQTINGNDVISTTWLLTLETVPEANWKSTLIGKDFFTRNAPSSDEVEQNFKFKAVSHPI